MSVEAPHLALARMLGLALALLLPRAATAGWEAETRPLPRAGKLVVVEDHRVPLITLHAVFPIGSHALWWQDRHLDVLWPTLVGRVEERKSAAAIRGWYGETHCGVSATFLRGERDEALADLSSALHEDFDKKDFDDRALLRRFWREQRASPSFSLAQALGRIFYARTDPRRVHLNRPRPAKFSSEEILEMRSEVLELGGWVVGFAGDITPNEAQRMVDALFPGAEARSTVIPKATEIAALKSMSERPAIRAVVAPRTPEVLLAWSREGVRSGAPEAAAAVLAEAVVQRRVSGLVRGTRGDSYTILSTGILADPVDIYQLVTMTSPERAPEHAREVESLLGEVARDGLTEAEVERARHILLGQEQQELHSPNEALDAALDAALAPPGDLGPISLLQAAREVPFAEVNAFARAFFDPATMSRVRVVPRTLKKELGPRGE